MGSGWTGRTSARFTDLTRHARAQQIDEFHKRLRGRYHSVLRRRLGLA
jgi:hypothetical protein